jgi:hypothetical protein
LLLVISFIERNWRTLVAYFGRGMRWLHNAQSEVESARGWFARVTYMYTYQLRELDSTPQGLSTTDDPQKVVATAREKLKAAQDMLDLAERRMR